MSFLLQKCLICKICSYSCCELGASVKTGTKLCISKSRASAVWSYELDGICYFHEMPCQALKLFIVIISSETPFMASIFLAPAVWESHFLTHLFLQSLCRLRTSYFATLLDEELSEKLSITLLNTAGQIFLCRYFAKNTFLINWSCLFSWISWIRGLKSFSRLWKSQLTSFFKEQKNQLNQRSKIPS